MKLTKLVAVLLCSMSLLSGCIFVNSGGNGHLKSHEYHKQKFNNEQISLLDIGATRDEVIDLLGEPDASEATKIDESEYYVLYYITQKASSDEESIISQSTPLVFKDNLLLGWGSEILEKVKY